MANRFLFRIFAANLVHSLHAQVREAHLRMRKPTPRRSPARLLRSFWPSSIAEIVQAKTRRARAQGQGQGQPIRMPGPVRTWPQPCCLSGCCLVQRSNAGRCRRNHRLTHCWRDPGRAATLEGLLHQHSRLRAQTTQNLVEHFPPPRHQTPQLCKTPSRRSVRLITDSKLPQLVCCGGTGVYLPSLALCLRACSTCMPATH